MADRRIEAFRQDEHGDFVAVLECGHTQHVRHRPPWQVREWVTTEAGRKRMLATLLPCPECDRPQPPR